MRSGNPDSRRPQRRHWLPVLTGMVLLVFTLPVLVGGIWLMVIGGSWYYFAAGNLLLLAAVHLMARSIWGVGLYLSNFLFTLIWSFWEVGLSPWGLLPRLLPLALLLLPVLYSAGYIRRSQPQSLVSSSAMVVLGALIVSGLVIATDSSLLRYPGAPSLMPLRVEQPQANASALAAAVEQPAGIAGTGADWPVYGGSLHAHRFSSLTQIDRSNVDRLTRVWTFRTGDMPGKPDENYAPETTPLVIDGTMYLCSAMGIVIGLDAASGEELWRYDPQVSPEFIPYSATCRGVAYHAEAPGTDGECAARIISGTLDGRLLSVDARTGDPCPEFGQGGEIDLLTGIGESAPGFLSVTSPPVIIRNTIITGHQVLDNQQRDAPAGVIRGFDVVTGELVWAWDMLRPESRGLPPNGEIYSRGTPDMWTIASGDEALGLVYLPMANAANAYHGSDRSEIENQYSTSLVALDVSSGEVAWHFQTVHYDVWDYDLASQATLVDFPAAGGWIPALILSTRQGDIYVLNRETGESLFPVVERPVPQGGVEPGNLSPTQPFSSYHTLAKQDLRESDMWGITPWDQLWCRISYRSSSYTGIYTPPTAEQRWIQYPGYNGGSDWGGVTLDPMRRILIANYNDIPNSNRLVPRAEMEQPGVVPIDALDPDSGEAPAGFEAQAGAPYGIDVNAGWRVGPTGLPCTRPPYGGIRAIALESGETLWDRPLGEARRNGPFGIPSMLPVTIGTPNNGGSIATASGLLFIAAATDQLLRAIDIETGETLWREILPAGGQATPISYAVGGRQYVTLMAGGHHFMETDIGDHVITWALPDENPDQE